MTTSSPSSSFKKLKQTQEEKNSQNFPCQKVPENNIYDFTDEDAFAQDLMFPASGADLELMNGVPLDPLDIFALGSENSDDLSDELPYYDYDDLIDYDDDFSYYDDTLSLQAQFDAVDLPPGVEASIPWLDLELPAKSQKKPAASSSSTVPSQLNSSREKEEEDRDEVLKKFRLFKRFDTVQDYSDHHFNHGSSKSKQAPRNWTKIVQQEWKILEKDLPDMIFVRVYEERMDLLRAVIIGAVGTPYHDGLFFFDICFPYDYPNVPPQVYYYSGGLRLNPNLYSCGKVCLSLLNTWRGNKNEQWMPGKSTMLQVLLSIQALVLNTKPFFNEPGYERMAGRKDGEKKAQDYNENAFILSCKTMLYTLRRPPKHFEDFVTGHFRECAHAILVACKAYIEGAQVGCLVRGGVQDVDEGDKSGSQKFKKAVGGILGGLVPAFIQNGAKDCEQFIPLADINRKTPLKP